MKLFISLVFCLIGGSCIAKSEENLARERPTYQSSTDNDGSDGDSDNAVDGHRNPDLYEGHCSQTSSGPKQYWYVELEKEYHIQAVVIYNRQDCCWKRLNNTEVFVVPNVPESWDVDSQYLCGAIVDLPINVEKIEIQCGYRQGRYVLIRKTDSISLTLCEVEVFKQRNLARGQQAIQTTTYGDAVSGRAVDGNTNSVFNDGSCTRTNSSHSEFWAVTLDAEYLIDEVVIYNPLDCCSEMGNNTEVKVYSATHLCGNYSLPSLNENPIVIHCNEFRGKYVALVKDTGNNIPLSLCEVEVYEKRQNLARKKKTFGDNSNLVVDGRTTTCYHNNGTADETFLYVDLGAQYIITDVDIYHKSGLENTAVYIFPTIDKSREKYESEYFCKKISTSTSTTPDRDVEKVSFQCTGTRAQFVFIKRSDEKPFSLCEVDVYMK